MTERTDLQRLRLKIQDRPRVTLREIAGIGDGGTKMYQTQMHPIRVESEEILVDSTPLDPEDDYEINYDLGLITLESALTAGASLSISYQWSAFSDVELEDYLLQYANLTRAAIAALESVLADSDRYIKYSFGQESVDRSTTRQAIKDLLDRLEQEMRGHARLVTASTAEEKSTLLPYVTPPYNDDAI